MERFAADLHIHSRYSRATSKELSIRSLAAWGRVKGLSVLGTGDFTHPGWLAEIEETLQEDGSGLLTLKDAAGLDGLVPGLPALPPGQTRFLLQAEISSIYKKAGKVRKVHNLVYMPGLDAARRFNERLAQAGNLESDGRPILGLDSRLLLEMVLETHPLAFLVPAHIWTPWFSLFGSKSGFNSIEACFEDLAGEIFAMETGLSSDPEMNWTWSALDRIRLISNSDAHSGEKLGRECNLFRGELSYEGIYRALRGEGLGHKFLGTVEFFPEEGKYHLDGHRACKVVMDPEETRARHGICPVCGRPVTLGVLSRITELADRKKPEPPPGAPAFTSLIPLKEILGEVLDAGPATKKVHQLYLRLMQDFGSELNVLMKVPADELKDHSPLLAEGVQRMREGKVIRTPGYDGEYGVISVFTEQERRESRHGGRLVAAAPGRRGRPRKAAGPEPEPAPVPEAPAALEFNAAQRRAIKAGPGPVLVLAGPGTGKTQTLMGRIDRLLEAGENPRRVLALTFTRRAARELRERLLRLLGLAEEAEAPLPQAGTLHAHGYEYWKHIHGEAPVVLDDASARRVFLEVNPELAEGKTSAFDRYVLARETLSPLPPELAEPAARYARQKASWNQADYTDLLEFQREQFTAPGFASPYAHVLVDEVQDLTPLQLAVVTALAGAEGRGFFAIGDPNQSIYGFRGAAGDAAEVLRRAWPDLETVTLTENFRSAQAILDCARGLFPESARLEARRDRGASIHLFQAPDALQEASWLAERIKRLLGPTSHTLADGGEGGLAPGDVAVLVRFRGLIPALETALKRFGVPVSAPEAEAFWNEPRVAAILGAAGRILGMSCAPGPDCPDFPEKALALGPEGLAAHLRDTPPFDQFFWSSRAFREMREAFGRRGGWAGLINWVHLQSELEAVRRSAEKVQIMSLHAAKGLEFEAVFLPALEDGILPFAGADMLTGKFTAPDAMPDAAEERRLLYVGLTRARRELFLSHAAKRSLYGRTLRLPPSRFLKELPAESMTRSTLAAHTVKKEKQMTLF